MKMYVKMVFITTLAAQFSGCGWLFNDEGMFRDRSNDYRKAKIDAPLTMPEGITNKTIDDNYVVPPISDHTTLSDKFDVPRPEPLSADVNRDVVRINKLGSQQWILVDGSPGAVWPRLRGFLSLNQLAVQRADAVNGIIETNWIQPNVENSIKERYRLRIEQGVQRDTCEVYILHSDIRAGSDNWPKSSSNIEREELMMQELAQYLADSTAAASVSMLAQQAIDSSGKVTIEEDSNSQPYIKLMLPFARSWASLGNALRKSGFKVDDLDRSKQRYYTHYLEGSSVNIDDKKESTKDVEEEKGFFSSLFGSDDDADKGIAYIISVEKINEQSVIISISRQSGEVMAEGEADKLLKTLKRHIS